MPFDGPLAPEVDGDAFEKVVMNYLSNALKYTPPGSDITLGLLVEEESIRAYVKDTGPGYLKRRPSGTFQSVFASRWFRDAREYEGTGLGLALAKEMAEK